MMSRTAPPPLTDSTAHRRFRDRAAAGFGAVDFLKKAVDERLVDRLLTIRRRFPLVLDLGCHHGSLARAMLASGKVDRVIAADPSPLMAAQASGFCPAFATDYHALPLAEASLDAVVSSGALHWAEDLPGVLIQLRRLLKPDGLLLVALAGGTTLANWRAVLAEAETELRGGMAPRVLPMADIRDLGGLLGRAGLALPVADADTLTITWPDALRMVMELRAMGEGNALAQRHRAPLPRAVLYHAAMLYQQRYGAADGRVAAEFEIITLTGWAPDKSQQQPLRPGSASARLADALGGEEEQL